MTIDTRYNIGDKVWLISNNRCFSGTICGFQCKYGIGYRYGQFYTGKENVKIQYCVDVPNLLYHVYDIDEDNLFSTQEELINSLINGK